MIGRIGNTSEVVEAMRQAKEAAWQEWWRHVTGVDRLDVSKAEELWRSYEDATIVFNDERDQRARFGGQAAA